MEPQHQQNGQYKASKIDTGQLPILVLFYQHHMTKNNVHRVLKFNLKLLFKFNLI